MDCVKRPAESDLDYELISRNSQKRTRVSEENNVTDVKANCERIIMVINKEFKNETLKKQEEIQLIQKRLLKAQKTLHLLKYVIIKSFYERKDLKLSNVEESVVQFSSDRPDTTKLALPSQNRIHPAVKKLIGKKPLIYEAYRTRTQAQSLSITIKEEPAIDFSDTKSNSICTKTEIQQSENSVLNINDINATRVNPIRNRQKNKYQLVVGNISKWISVNNSQDSSTHKWMIYVRGPRDDPDISQIVKKVRFFLHPSYQPNDIVELEEPPFHLSRRGWGEFPLRVQIHFQCTANKPVDVIHNLKLDRTYTGRQTLGNETLINVWLYDGNAEDEDNVLQTLECIVDNRKHIKSEPNDDPFNCNTFEVADTVLSDVQNKPSDNVNFILTSDEMNCDRNIKEEIGLNDIHGTSDTIISEHSKQVEHKSVSNINAALKKLKMCTVNGLSKNSIASKNSYRKSLLKCNNIARDTELIYLVDHCYTNEVNKINADNHNRDMEEDISVAIDPEKYKIDLKLTNFSSTRQLVYFLFKSLPLVTPPANDPSYRCCYPYAAATMQQFSSWNQTKRYCSEWFRAKHIKNTLIQHKVADAEVWTVKIILMFGRAHAFTPLAKYDIFRKKSESGKTVPNRMLDIEIASTLSQHDSVNFNVMNKVYVPQRVEENCIIDVECTESTSVAKVAAYTSRSSGLDSKMQIEEQFLVPCTYVKKCAEDLKIYLKPEEIIPDVSYNLSERLLLESIKCFAEELIRRAFANKIVRNKGRNFNSTIEKNEILTVLLERPEFDIFLNEGLGKAVELPTTQL